MPKIKKRKPVSDPMTFAGEGEFILDKGMSNDNPYIGMVQADRPGEGGSILGPQTPVDTIGPGTDITPDGGQIGRGNVGAGPIGPDTPGPQLGFPPGTGAPEPPAPDDQIGPPRGPGTPGPPRRTEQPVVEEPKKAEPKVDIIIPNMIQPPPLPQMTAARAAGGAAGGGAKEEEKKKKAFPWWILIVAGVGIGGYFWYKSKKK